MGKWIVVAGLIGFLAGAAMPASAQRNWQGLFVSPPSGGTWLINGAKKHPLWIHEINQDDFDQFETGDVIMAGDSIIVPAPGVATPPPVPIPQPPARSAPVAPTAPAVQRPAGISSGGVTIAETGQGCDRDAVFAIRVEKLEMLKTLGNRAADGVWAVLSLNVTNQGPSPANLYLTFMLEDERGRQFEMAGNSEIDVTTLRREREARGLKGEIDTLQPGIAYRVMAVFQVAPDVVRLKIVPNRLYCR